MAAVTAVEASCTGYAQHMFELGEDLLDRVQIGGIFRRQEELGAGRGDRRGVGALGA